MKSLLGQASSQVPYLASLGALAALTATHAMPADVGVPLISATIGHWLGFGIPSPSQTTP